MARRYADERTRIGDTPDDGPEFDGMTFEEFQASGRDVDDIAAVTGEDWLIGVNGRMYCNDTLWAVPCVTSGIGWSTIIGNREFQSRHLKVIERKLYEFAVAEGMGV